jgi:CheY-like chemotaxis protein
VLDRMKNIASLACTPVIVLSARDLHANEERALKAGAEATSKSRLITKSF